VWSPRLPCCSLRRPRWRHDRAARSSARLVQVGSGRARQRRDVAGRRPRLRVVSDYGERLLPDVAATAPRRQLLDAVPPATALPGPAVCPGRRHAAARRRGDVAACK